ncbi:hypothetical protein IAR50_000015 [Cryptococcus sp. DSM 104548]
MSEPSSSSAPSSSLPPSTSLSITLTRSRPTTQDIFSTLRPLLFTSRSALSAIFQLLTPSQSLLSLPHPLFPTSPSYEGRIGSTWNTHKRPEQLSEYPSMADWRGMRTKLLTAAETSTSEAGVPLKQAKFQLNRLERQGKLESLTSALLVSQGSESDAESEEREESLGRDGIEAYHPESLCDILMDNLLTSTAEDMTIAEEVLKDVNERGAKDLKERLEGFLEAAGAQVD